MSAVYSGECPASGGSQTNIPAPWNVSTIPALRSSSIARSTVFTATWYRVTSSAFVGSCEPGGYSPLLILARRSSAIRWYFDLPGTTQA